jgi:hypothetical protein
MNQRADDNDERSAVLRSDEPKPILTVWGEDIPVDALPEYLPQIESMTLFARLEGKLCTSEISDAIYTEELNDLIGKLTAFATLQVASAHWQTMDRRLSLQFDIDRRKSGSHVACNIRLQSGYDNEEEHRYLLATNLPWVDNFLTGLQRLVMPEPQ